MAITEDQTIDPWKSNNVNPSDHSNVDFASSGFEDNFTVPADKLADHEQYLATITKQLNKIKTNPNLLQQLSEKKEACMHQLLLSTTSPTIYDSIEDLDDAIPESSVLRTLAPQKQALTKGELAELVKYDQLKNSSEEEDEEVPVQKGD